MDIEDFVESPGRDEMVREVRKKIDELGIEYLYLQFVSVTGKIMGKGIPADHWETVSRKGFQLVYGATMNLFTNRAGDYLGYGPEAAELVGVTNLVPNLGHGVQFNTKQIRRGAIWEVDTPQMIHADNTRGNAGQYGFTKHPPRIHL